MDGLTARDEPLPDPLERGHDFRVAVGVAWEQLGDAYIGRIARQMNETGAAWAEGDVFQESYEDVVKVLRKNPLTAVPSELLLVGRVFGLLNGLSMSLHAKKSMLTAFAELAEEMEAKDNGSAEAANGAATSATRRLLETR